MISAVVLTRNSQNQIGNCLQSVAWCDEIIVIDDYSTDKTIDIAQKSKAIVYSRVLNKDFSAQRNFALEKAKEEWILFIDSDEIVSASLAKEIQEICKHQTADGYYIKRTDYMWGKELLHGETANIKFLRLAKKNAGKWQGKVHEVWKVTGTTSELSNPIEHFPHQTIKEFLSEINNYSSIRAQELFANKCKVSFFSIVLYPKAKFLLNYFVRSGYKDGIPGLIFVIMMSFHSFLVRAKLWQLWQKQTTH